MSGSLVTTANGGKIWIVNDTFAGYMVLRQSHATFSNASLIQQRKSNHLIARHRLITFQDAHPLGQLARFPAELREMIFVHAFNVGKVIPYQQPCDDGKTSFEFESYDLPPIPLLRAGWSLCQEARKYLWTKNIVILQGQNTEKLEEIVYNFSEEPTQPARKFYVRLSWNDMSGPALGAIKSDAITEMKQRGFWTTWSREVRLQHIHDNVRDGLLAFWWSRLALVNDLQLDHLTIDFREATCPEFCCEDLAAKAAWNSPRLLYGLPSELKVVANDGKYGRKLKWLYR